jgi:DHA1 family multidrug/chloramphenicol efflux transport protein-like MFS transporter
MTKKNYSFLFPLLLVLYELPTYLSNDAYLPALPTIMHDFGTTQRLVQLTLTTWFLGTAFLQLVLGPIADRYGRRPVLLTGGIVFVISSVGCALAPNIGSLLIFRFIQGLTITSMIVAGYSTVHDLFDHNKAIHTLAWMYSISVLAPSAGPLLGAIILHFAGWRYIFWVLALWAAVIVLGLSAKMPETATKIPGSVHPKQITSNYIQLLVNFRYMSPALSACLLFGSMIAWLSAGPFLVMTEFHRNVFTFAIFQLLVFGFYVIGTRAVKCFLNRYESRLLINIGLSVALFGGFAALFFAFIIPKALFGIVFSTMLIAASGGFCSPMLNRTAVEAAQVTMGARVALYSCLMSIFGIIASVLISSVYNGTLFSLAVILFLFTLVAFILNFALNQKTQKRLAH